MTKRILFSILLLLGVSAISTAQIPAYYFTVLADTAIEQNATHITGYVKTNDAPTDADSVLVLLKAGQPRFSHIDTTTRYVLHIAAGQDSVPFSIILKDDTFPELPEHLSYVIQNYGSNSQVAADSVLNFVLNDNDLPATIRIIGDSAWAWEHNGRYWVKMVVNNPNSFNVRFTADNHDAYYVGGSTVTNAFALFDFYYNGETMYARPGSDTLYKSIDIVDNRVAQSDRTLACIIRNIDANIIVDTLLQFTIRDDDGPSPVANYYFNTTRIDSFTEQNATLVSGYVKTDSVNYFEDSVYLILKSGFVSSTQIDHPNQFVLHFAPGQDSIPFTLVMHDDTFPQGTEYLTYIISTPYWAKVGRDSTRQMVVFDNDLAATIRILGDSGWAWEHDGSYRVAMEVNNPNPFNVRFVADNHDAYYVGGAPLTAFSIRDFYYNAEVMFARPGIDTIYKNIDIVDDTINQPDKTLACIIRNIDANILVDTFFFFRIRNDDYYYPPTVSFGFPTDTVWKGYDLYSKVPVYVNNPNWKRLDFRIDTIAALTNITTNHEVVPFHFLSYGRGTWIDTFRIQILNDHLLQDTQVSVYHIYGFPLNTSPDTLYKLVVIGSDTVHVSFKGAAMAHLKSDSIGYVQVCLNGASKFPVSADVKYLNGNATPGVDFIFRDSSITFRANQFDTISLPVIMLKDHIRQGNEQVNLELTNVQPATVIPDIIRYSYIIIDDDSTALYASINSNAIDVRLKFYPNPFADRVHIATELEHYKAEITNSMGQVLYSEEDISGDKVINASGYAAGMFIIRVSAEGNTIERKLIKY